MRGLGGQCHIHNSVNQQRGEGIFHLPSGFTSQNVWKPLHDLRGKFHIIDSGKKHSGEIFFHLYWLSPSVKCLNTHAVPRRILPYTPLCETTLWCNSLPIWFHRVRTHWKPMQGLYCQTALCGNHLSTNSFYHYIRRVSKPRRERCGKMTHSRHCERNTLDRSSCK